MRIINHILFYSEEDVGKGKSIRDFAGKRPKGKYVEARLIEDCFVDRKVGIDPKTGLAIKQKMQNAPGQNREQRRHEARRFKSKGHKLDYHQRKIKRNRQKEKNRRKQNAL
jgi:hypothetical protein